MVRHDIIPDTLISFHNLCPLKKYNAILEHVRKIVERLAPSPRPARKGRMSSTIRRARIVKSAGKESATHRQSGSRVVKQTIARAGWVSWWRLTRRQR